MTMQVSASTDWLGRLVCNHPAFWIKLGAIETKLLAPDLPDAPAAAPIYISGLARSGSTILLEILARHPDCTSHRYQDFPFLFTPYWWNTLLKFSPSKSRKAQERAHGDGIMITPESPEAMEEMLWMAFFEHLHDPTQSNVLGRTTSYPEFETFYRDHIKKLLLARKRKRYVSKGNYNISRMAYLQRLSPDAKFILPIRDPVSHVASLVRQHKRFSDAGHADKRATAHMSQVGHFEFGLNRIPVNTGNVQRIQEIQAAWKNGEEIRGFALYWDMIYRFVYDQLNADPILAKSTKILSHATLCADPNITLREMLSHCQLSADNAWLDTQAKMIRPEKSATTLSAEEIKLIKDITGQTATLFQVNLTD